MQPDLHRGQYWRFIALLDASEAFKQAGLQVVVVRSGDAKGKRIDGLKIEQDELDRLQSHVDHLARIFIARVARGRNLGVVRATELATRDVWIGESAKERGLVDRVAYLPDVLREIAERNAPTANEQRAAAIAAAVQKREQERAAQRAAYERRREIRRSLGMHVG